MISKLVEIENRFYKNSDSVKELMNFDRVILDFCISQIDCLNTNLKEVAKINNPMLLVDRTLLALQGIREHDSMRNQYEPIFNQCLVLLVSHFTVALEDFFKSAIDVLISKNKFGVFEKDESIKISLNELITTNFDLTNNFGELLLKKKEISFQDMQSTNRAFFQYLNYTIPTDSNLNNVIFAQASRHTIVHSSAIADDKFIHQIRNILPRDIKQGIRKNEKIKMTPDEIILIDNSMRNIISNCINIIKKAAANTTQATPA